MGQFCVARRAQQQLGGVPTLWVSGWLAWRGGCSQCSCQAGRGACRCGPYSSTLLCAGMPPADMEHVCAGMSTKHVIHRWQLEHGTPEGVLEGGWGGRGGGLVDGLLGGREQGTLRRQGIGAASVRMESWCKDCHALQCGSSGRRLLHPGGLPCVCWGVGRGCGHSPGQHRHCHMLLLLWEAGAGACS